MAKSVWKIPFIPIKYIRKNVLKKNIIVTRYRNVIISPLFQNKKISLYNGRWMMSFDIKFLMIGHKLGEFIFTKKLGSGIHNRSKKKKKKR